MRIPTQPNISISPDPSKVQSQRRYETEESETRSMFASTLRESGTKETKSSSTLSQPAESASTPVKAETDETLSADDPKSSVSEQPETESTSNLSDKPASSALDDSDDQSGDASPEHTADAQILPANFSQAVSSGGQNHTAQFSDEAVTNSQNQQARTVDRSKTHSNSNHANPNPATAVVDHSNAKTIKRSAGGNQTDANVTANQTTVTDNERIDASQSGRQSAGDQSSWKQQSQQRQTNTLQTSSSSANQHPAEARASIVDDAIRLENASGKGGSEVKPVVTTHGSSPPSLTLSPGKSSDATGLPRELMGTTSQESPANKTTQSVMRGLRAMVNQRGGTMTMRLDPPELGQLRVQMTIVQGAVAAELHTFGSSARSVLEQNLPTLRTALESQGLTVERLVVQHGQPGGHSAMRHDGGEQSQLNHRHSDAGEGESRGRSAQEDQPDRQQQSFTTSLEELFDGETVEEFALQQGDNNQ